MYNTLYDMKPIKIIFYFIAFVCGVMPANAQGDNNKSNLLGLVGGVAFTTNPTALQKLTNKSHYVDGNGGFTYLHHYQGSDNGYAFECQLSFICSSVQTLEHADNETKMKFIVPLDFRWFLGSQVISAYIGAGLQYNTVWVFTSEDDDVYYDPWWGGYYTEPGGLGSWGWTVNQLSSNIAVGIKTGMGSQKQHNIMLGGKIHVPIVNSSEHHESGNSSVDLSKDKVSVSLTGGFSIGFKDQAGAVKVDCEYPLGGSSKYIINDGGHSTFFNTHSWSLSATALFTLGRKQRR